MSTISVYTTVTNAIQNEYFAIEGIGSALLFADEVVVVDGKSTDNTVEQIRKINDPRIKIFESEWLHSLGKSMTGINKSIALGHCTSDWCVLMDSDEVFHEHDAEKIKSIANSAPEAIIAIDFHVLHFYKGYQFLLNGNSKWKDLYTHKVYMVRNKLCIHHGAVNSEPDAHVDLHGRPLNPGKIAHADITVFHYGHARTKESYVRKLNHIEGRHSGWTKEAVTTETFEWIPDDELFEFTGLHPHVMDKRIAAGLNSYDKIMELYK